MSIPNGTVVWWDDGIYNIYTVYFAFLALRIAKATAQHLDEFPLFLICKFTPNPSLINIFRY